MNDKWTIRAVVLFLGIMCMGGLGCVTVLAYNSITVPETINNLTVAALAGLTALLVNTRSHPDPGDPGEPPVKMQLTGGQSGPGSDVEVTDADPKPVAHKSRALVKQKITRAGLAFAVVFVLLSGCSRAQPKPPKEPVNKFGRTPAQQRLSDQGAKWSADICRKHARIRRMKGDNTGAELLDGVASEIESGGCSHGMPTTKGETP